MQIKTFVVAACLLAFAWPASAAATEIPGDCGDKRLVGIQNVSRAFAERSVEIIRLAKRNEVSRLRPLVAPSATFIVWNGDSALVPHGGPLGAVDFARTIDPATYRYASTFVGPISSDICGTETVTLWFRGSRGERDDVAEFKYSKGLLVQVTATMADVSEGKI